jgi:hypothetical protein
MDGVDQQVADERRGGDVPTPQPGVGRYEDGPGTVEEGDDETRDGAVLEPRLQGPKIQDAGQAAPDLPIRRTERKGEDDMGGRFVWQLGDQTLYGLADQRSLLSLRDGVVQDPRRRRIQLWASHEGALAHGVDDLKVDEGAIRLGGDILEEDLEVGEIDRASRLESADGAVELDPVTCEKLGNLDRETTRLQ